MKKPTQLLRIEDLDNSRIKKIIETAYKKLRAEKISLRKGKSKPVALIFAEASTRTRVSFQRAARMSALDTYLIESSSSSIAKGEDLKDTVLNLQAMGIENFVVRTSSTEELLALRDLNVGVINAGDGVGEHPSQALLDLLCLYSKSKASWGGVQNKTICIVGNLSHSRVVNSWIALAKALGIKLRLVSPPAWAPQDKTLWTSDLSEGLAGADVVMALRVQKERLVDVSLDPAAYQITESLLKGRPLMHPGPINWGVELAPSLRSYENSWILDQVRCGLYLRATLLNEFIAT